MVSPVRLPEEQGERLQGRIDDLQHRMKKIVRRLESLEIEADDIANEMDDIGLGIPTAEADAPIKDAVSDRDRNARDALRSTKELESLEILSISDDGSSQVLLNKCKTIRLTAALTALLLALLVSQAESAGRFVEWKDLSKKLNIESHALAVRISRLRDKLAAAANPKLLQYSRGDGYRISVRHWLMSVTLQRSKIEARPSVPEDVKQLARDAQLILGYRIASSQIT
jgi:DNA-binding response OmpR family regulator